MKALYFSKYGSTKNLRLIEVDKPEPKPEEVLVKVVTTAVNDYDWGMIRGKPLILRLMYGLFRPKKNIPGMELAGVVEACGSSVTSLKVGDAVYGDTSQYAFGTFAEYICVNEKGLAIIPENLSFEMATAIPHAGMLALQGLKDIGNLQKGQKVLINGAGGGVGTFALQLAQEYEAEVTGVDTGEKLQMMRDLGFDHVIDYKQQNFTRNGIEYDLILDNKTMRSPAAYLRSLKPGGMYVTVGGNLLRLMLVVLLGPLFGRATKKRFRLLALDANKDLRQLSEKVASSKIKCIIDGPYPLEKAAWAFQYFGEGKHSGKVVIRVS